ncbi:anti-sigma factor [Flaviaesturariibacter flavus]|uniref:Anti-sigma factor n=1 Tax=Flaviaesturariibacter flavus TaxID=2502780 RepID=A0A4R1BAS8_9BACT|nr:anti-sigma factor [Flaviaesturariibacter flavus]TCJ14075.1 anti-sigma factor [Flaviaesturariibacter flavus]
MNVKEYISSGIIESYVLGLASDAERQEFEAACAQYPAIAEARDRFELQLEETLLAEAAAPSPALKARITAALEEEAVLPVHGDGLSAAPVRRINPWKWVAAACILLAAGSVYWAISLNSRMSSLEAKQQQSSQLAAQLDSNRSALAEMRQEAETLRNPNLKMTSLQSVPTAPTRSNVTVFWDSTSKDVYLLIRNLPAPASDKQYQLWALIDKKPVDLGVFEIRQDRLMVKMKNVQNAQAFAITLEPKGGSPTPTLKNMYVYGEL